MNAHTSPAAIEQSSLRYREVMEAFRCSQTLRRMAHEDKREAMEALALGKMERFERLRTESDRRWRSAKWHLNYAKQWRLA